MRMRRRSALRVPEDRVGEPLPGESAAGATAPTGGAASGVLLPLVDHLWLSLLRNALRAAIIGCVMRSVLVVDDDPEFRELAGRLLAASGLSVVGEAGSVSAGFAG